MKQMFPLIRRCCFYTPFKLRKVTGSRLLLYGRNKTSCSSLSLCLQRDVCPLSRPPGLSPAAAPAVKLQALHTSLPLLKKKTPPESELRRPGVVRRSVALLQHSPRPALYLTLSGLVPFVSMPLAMAIQGTYSPELAFAQVTYGAVTVSFLGGMRWGFALPEGGPAKPDWLNLANSCIPPVLAWQALLLKSIPSAAIMVIIALGIALHYDVSLLPTYPQWFKVLRVMGTVVMTLSLLATLVVKIISEDQLSNSRNEQQN
ncbi:TMM69 protein, partial [Alcedo cyanopectus]|nr:TMM69 protein [Ceyx cyanopectus]